LHLLEEFFSAARLPPVTLPMHAQGEGKRQANEKVERIGNPIHHETSLPHRAIPKSLLEPDEVMLVHLQLDRPHPILDLEVTVVGHAHSHGGRDPGNYGSHDLYPLTADLLLVGPSFIAVVNLAFLPKNRKGAARYFRRQ